MISHYRLWVLDSGVINDMQVCPAKLVMFDLRSKSIPPFTHIFPGALSRTMSLFITPVRYIPQWIAHVEYLVLFNLIFSKVVDVRNCNDLSTMVYIADVTGFGLIVFDYKNNRSWRAESQYNHLQPINQYSNFTIAGETFNLMDGVFGLALSPKTC